MSKTLVASRFGRVACAAVLAAALVRPAAADPPHARAIEAAAAAAAASDAVGPDGNLRRPSALPRLPTALAPPPAASAGDAASGPAAAASDAQPQEPENPQLRWVVGSWVAVRSEARVDAQVLRHLSTNTPVWHLNERGDFCRVSWGDEQRGYLVCSALAEQALDPDLVTAPVLANGSPNPQYSAPRAFWIAPSIERLFDAGEHFWNVRLSAEQKARERPDVRSGPLSNYYNPRFRRPLLTRPAIPEFEAMKARMRDGVVATPDLQWRWVRWSTATATAVENEVDPHLLVLKSPRLRGPSVFGRGEHIAPPRASAEHISAQFGLPYRLHVVRQPRWVTDEAQRRYPRYDGAWDIGEAEATLVAPVIVTSLGRNELLSLSRSNAPQRFRREGPVGAGCSAEARPPGAQSPLAWFYSRQALPFTNLKVRSTAYTHPTDGTGPRRLLLHEIDIDDDGILDVAVWESRQMPAGAVLAVSLVNLGGLWHVLDIARSGECG